MKELGAKVAEFGWCYVVTTGEERPHLLAARVDVVDGLLRCRTGKSSRANVERNPLVVLAFPAREEGAMSLIVDGAATADDDGLVITPTWAVLHRAAV